MKIFFILFTIILLEVVYPQTQNVIYLKDGWKFKTGDNLNYAKPDFDDSNWKSIGVNKIWEEQGYDSLDGFAWYRIKFFLPSSLKENSYLKDSLKIFAGKINNYDQSFINGKIFGINGKNVPAQTKIDTSFINAPIILWDYPRRYTLGVKDPRILWNKENVLAFRVYDQGGQGGIYTGDLSVSMVKISEYLSINYNKVPFKFEKDSITKSFTLKNTSRVLPLTGIFKINGINKVDRKVVLIINKHVKLKPLQSKKFKIAIDDQEQSTVITYKFVFNNNRDESEFKEETPYILTPEPALIPKINGAKIYGERPGKPFLYKIAVTGKAPIYFDALNLPNGLTVDHNSGIISGRIAKKGEYEVTLVAKNDEAEAKRNLKIIIGDKIALTPPMGWNSWNCWGLSVSQKKVLASAKSFVEKGLINHGWTFINIDDGWEIKGDSPDPKRDAEGNILTNEKFPDMKALGDSIHSLGLKFGIYSSPGPLTCGGYTASYQHELQDAKSYSNWGIDYLKYDWCSYDNIAKDTSLAERMKPYLVMDSAFQKIDRDIVFSLCQYGMSNVWEWGAKVNGNLWRTTGDITDNWESMSGIGFNQIVNAKYAGPGHWNDPDMLVVGWVGWGENLHPTKLTPDEQYTHISLWCMLSAPLLIGCDLERLDPFTLNLLENDEVLALDQDPLGQQAIPVLKNDSVQVYKKNLADGNIALGIFNLSKETKSFNLNLKSVGIEGNCIIRDLWRQKNLGNFKKEFNALVPSHGVILLKVTKI